MPTPDFSALYNDPHVSDDFKAILRMAEDISRNNRPRHVKQRDYAALLDALPQRNLPKAQAEREEAIFYAEQVKEEEA